MGSGHLSKSIANSASDAVRAGARIDSLALSAEILLTPPVGERQAYTGFLSKLKGVGEPLSLPPEEMRRLGYAVVDRIVDHVSGLSDAPPLRVGDPAALRAALGGPPPEAPGDPDAALAALFEQ